jgi:phosphoglycolate phosphatase
MRAILFDLEGTLVESLYQQEPETIQELRRATRERLVGLGVPREELEGLVRSTDLRNRAFSWAEEGMGEEGAASLREAVEAFMRDFDMESARRTRVYPETPRVLRELDEAGFPMGVVTNTSRDAAGHILKRLGLSPFLGAVVTRSEVPLMKPDPGMIHAACSLLGSEAGWLVGDARFDSEAARNAGVTSVIIRRDGRRPRFQHDFFIESLEELPRIVSRST